MPGELRCLISVDAPYVSILNSPYRRTFLNQRTELDAEEGKSSDPWFLGIKMTDQSE